MRAWLAIAVVLGTVSVAGAQLVPPPGQAQAGLPAQQLGFFKCFCTTTVGAPLPSQLSFAPPPSRQWTGSVYAASTVEAMSKAQSACTAERRSSLFDCFSCRCDR
jgi:hypothetical protein